MRLTIQPFDGPDGAEQIGRVMDQLQSDEMLLFASDFHIGSMGTKCCLRSAPGLRQKIRSTTRVQLFSLGEAAMLDAPDG